MSMQFLEKEKNDIGANSNVFFWFWNDWSELDRLHSFGPWLCFMLTPGPLQRNMNKKKDDDVGLIGQLAHCLTNRTKSNGWLRKEWLILMSCLWVPSPRTQNITREASVSCCRYIGWEIWVKGGREKGENIGSAASNLYYFRHYLKIESLCTNTWYQSIAVL